MEWRGFCLGVSSSFTEMDGKCQSDLIEPQGKIKEWEM